MPIPTETKSTSGPRGVANVKVYKNHVSIEFENDELGMYKIPREDDAVPESLTTGGRMNVSLNRDANQIWSAFPADGTYKAKFHGFPARDGEDPMPKDKPGGIRQSRNGGTWHEQPYRQITFLFEIQSGKFEGMVVPHYVRYLFVPFESTGLSKIYGRGRNRERLEEVLKACGIDFLEDNIPYSDNVLPALQEILLEKDTPFLLQMQDGWVQNLTDLPDGF